MVIVDNIKVILTKSYVAWAVYLGAAAQLVFEFGLNTQLPGWFTLVLLALILLGRTLKQDSVSGAKPEAEEPLGI